MSLTGHMSVRQGKMVFVLAKDGNHFKARFKEHTDKTVRFYDHTDVRTSDIRTISIFKEPKDAPGSKSE